MYQLTSEQTVNSLHKAAAQFRRKNSLQEMGLLIKSIFCQPFVFSSFLLPVKYVSAIR